MPIVENDGDNYAVLCTTLRLVVPTHTIRDSAKRTKTTNDPLYPSLLANGLASAIHAVGKVAVLPLASGALHSAYAHRGTASRVNS